MGQKDSFVGEEAFSKEYLLRRNPITKGRVTNWDDMEKIWYHTFYNELRVAPEDYPLLFTHSLFSLPSDREKMTQILFETIGATAVGCFASPLLTGTRSLLADSFVLGCGGVTGVGVEFGETVQVLPVYEGHGLFSAS